MRILSGIQPSGKLHIGNYFGMIRPAIELQQRGEAFLFIADYHALTTVADAAAMREGVRDVALDFLACGLDPERTAFYRQSDLPEVHELAWLLSNVTPLALLERCHSYKDKLAKGIAPNHGLLAYPVLMAADILIVQANVVPVGRDQKQHVEVTRDLAIKFNLAFGDTFTIPEPQIADAVAVVPGLDGQKMSKSYGNTIEIFGDPKATRKRIMSIVTDSKTLEEPDPHLQRLPALQAVCHGSAAGRPRSATVPAAWATAPPRKSWPICWRPFSPPCAPSARSWRPTRAMSRMCCKRGRPRRARWRAIPCSGRAARWGWSKPGSRRME